MCVNIKRTIDATTHAQRRRPRRPHLVEDAIYRHLPSSRERKYFLNFFLIFSDLILEFLESQGFVIIEKTKAVSYFSHCKGRNPDFFDVAGKI